jgi:hypothetical protein
MACGNNHVTRGHLSSQPTPVNSASAALSKAQVQAAITKQRLPKISVDGSKPRQAFQSRYSRGQVDYFIGPDGEQTHDPNLHIHVIHKANSDVTMHITNRRDHTRSTELALKAPDGNLVREAELALAEILRSLA